MTTNKKFISFIAPVYNVNKYLPDFLKSFLQFKHLDFEIILVDDKSRENPDEIIEEYSALLPIKVIKNPENMGQGFSRNVGMINIRKKTTHFMFVDPDDILLPEVEKTVEMMMDCIPVICDSFVKWNKRREKKVKIWRNNFYVGSRVEPSWGHVFPASFSNIEFTSRTHEDHKWMALATKGGFKWCNEPTIKYRERKSSALNENNKSRAKAEQIIEHVLESKRALDLGLVNDRKKFDRNMRYAVVEYKYIPKKNTDKNIPVRLSKGNCFLALLQSFFQNVIQFWFFYNLLTKHNKFE